MHAVMKDQAIARATHIIYAYRIDTGGKIFEHYHDDGEYGAGQKLLSLLRENDVKNEMIAVARWHNGPNIGPARFTCILKAANSVIKKHN